jgi:type IV secretory pathway VirB4 component
MAETPSQQFIPIEQVREGVVILKDKSIRGILMVSSVNFALKSEEEQGAIIYNFQNFLNSLDFSCQIVVNSRKANITGYIEKIKQIEEHQKNPLLKIQTADYIKFIEEIISSGSIMTKMFYVVVPYYPLLELPGMSNTDNKGKSDKVLGDLTEKKFQTGKYQLWQRMEYVSLGLRRCGLKSTTLGTEEILELLWGLHHPKQSELGYYPELPPEIIT